LKQLSHAARKQKGPQSLGLFCVIQEYCSRWFRLIYLKFLCPNLRFPLCPRPSIESDIQWHVPPSQDIAYFCPESKNPSQEGKTGRERHHQGYHRRKPTSRRKQKGKRKTDVNRDSPIFNESRLSPFVSFFPPHVINSFRLALIAIMIITTTARFHSRPKRAPTPYPS